MTWVVAVLALPLAWLLLSLLITGWHAKQASSALNAAAAQMTSGDPVAAADSIDSARSNTEALKNDINSLPISALKLIPYVRTNLEGATVFASSAMHVLDAAQGSNQLFAKMTGSDGSNQPVFANGTIDVAALDPLTPLVDQVDVDLAQAKISLHQVPPDISPLLRKYVDEAQARIDGIQRGISVYRKIKPALPELVGETTPATYLVVFHNPGELYPGGGAALNTAVVQFSEGKMEVLEKGPVSPDFTNPAVPWDPVSHGPYYAETNAKDGFAWSNLHQDFRTTGENMMRSWVATGHDPVDGVISLDAVALAAAVSATGPIDSQFYGQITADNLVQKLFFEGYNEDPAAQQQRKAVNQQLIDEMLARMQGGTGALSIGRAIFATAPGQHIRIHLSDNRLAKALREAQVDGAQPDPEPDRIAFYTQNQNASKVDIFQTRTVIHDVYLQDDGSATVVQTAKVTNNAPTDGGSPLSDRIGYTTRWAFHWNIVLLPESAKDVKLAANPGEIKTDNRVFTDVDGRKAVRVGRWIPPGESSYITVSYRLPDGTFGEQGNLEYRVGVEHQLTINDVDLTVNVSGPSQPRPQEGDWSVNGDFASTRFPVARPTTLALGIGDR
ncbi:MAG: DUF4012 domain-containing protein [Candidatus Nanopelagicales bacterium]